MRLTFAALGWTFDWSLEPTAEAEDADEPGRDLGYLSGTFVGFAPHVQGEDVALPQRVPAWDEPLEDRL